MILFSSSWFNNYKKTVYICIYSKPLGQKMGLHERMQKCPHVTAQPVEVLTYLTYYCMFNPVNILTCVMW